MSMDDTFAELQYFRIALERFNEQLRTSMNDLEQKHSNVSPHWQDEMRKTYDASWEPFHENMNRYINSQAPTYEQFLTEKINSLRRYLHG